MQNPRPVLKQIEGGASEGNWKAYLLGEADEDSEQTGKRRTLLVKDQPGTGFDTREKAAHWIKNRWKTRGGMTRYAGEGGDGSFLHSDAEVSYVRFNAEHPLSPDYVPPSKRKKAATSPKANGLTVKNGATPSAGALSRYPYGYADEFMQKFAAPGLLRNAIADALGFTHAEMASKLANTQLRSTGVFNKEVSELTPKERVQYGHILRGMLSDLESAPAK